MTVVLDLPVFNESNWNTKNDANLTSLASAVNTATSAIADRVDVVTPAQFGAVGDGVADDTDAVQQCVDTAATLGLTASLRGDHKITDRIVAPTGMKLVGRNGKLIQTTNLTQAIYGDDVTDVTITDVVVEGVGTDYVNNSSVYAAAAFYFTGTSSKIRLVRCAASNVAGAGAYFDTGVHKWAVIDCDLGGPGSGEITASTDGYGAGVVAIDCDNWIVSGTEVSEFAQGIVTGRCSNVRIQANNIHDIVGQHGMYLEPERNVAVSANIVTGTVLQGLKLQIGTTSWPDIENVSVTGNVITETGSHCILATNPVGGSPRLRELSITGNTLESNGSGDAIQFIDVIGAVVEGNTGRNLRVGLNLITSSKITVGPNRFDQLTRQGLVISDSFDIQVHGLRIIDPASDNDASSEFGVYLAGSLTAEITMDDVLVTDSGGNMRYGLYIVDTADQDTVSVKNSRFTGATDYGARMDSAQGIRAWSRVTCSGGSGAILNPATGVTETVTDVQTFSTIGTATWTKPLGAVACAVTIHGAGGGGGSGRRGAAGTARTGGGGGGAGGVTHVTVPASALDATETITIRGGGTGGAAVTTDDTDGDPGTAGGICQVGSKLFAFGGLGGGGGKAATAGSSGGVLQVGASAGGASSASGAVGAAAAVGSPQGGCSGGGITTGNVANNGGAQAFPTNTHSGYATGGVVDSTAPQAGVDAGFAGPPTRGAGGGAASITTAAQAGGAGGKYGGGGGGGGASLNGNNSGAGGAGAQGVVQIVTYF